MLATAPLVLVSLVTACSSSSSTTTKAGYVKRANAICADMNRQASALPKPGDSAPQLIDFLTKGQAVTAAALVKLRALAMPVGDEATLRAIYAGIDKQLGDFDILIASARGGSQSILTAAETNLETDSKALTEAADAYGLTECGTK
jgi:hypothetical protein